MWFFTLCPGLALALPALGAKQGLVDATAAPNRALLVGVSHGLPGIDIDVDNVEAMITHPAYDFRGTTLEDSAATTSNILRELTALSEDAGADGTLFFYFSGHGNVGVLSAQDRLLKIEEIKAAIQAGRRNQGPLTRFVMIIDSCYSGSLLDPVRKLYPLSQLEESRIMTTMMVDEVVKGLSPKSRADKYWEKLFVLASSRSDQTSLAGWDGSVFTNAMTKAFKETVASGTLGDFVRKSQEYTKGHNPVARMVPESLSVEKMIP